MEKEKIMKSRRLFFVKSLVFIEKNYSFKQVINILKKTSTAHFIERAVIKYMFKYVYIYI